MNEIDRKRLESKLSLNDRIKYNDLYQTELYRYRALGTITFSCKEHQSTLIRLEDGSWNCEDCINKMTPEQRLELKSRIESNIRCFDNFLIERSKLSYKIKDKMLGWILRRFK